MYEIDVLIHGFAGRAVCHGGLGWSTITLLRGGGRAGPVDIGALGVRMPLAKQLQQRGPDPCTLRPCGELHAVPGRQRMVGRRRAELGRIGAPPVSTLCLSFIFRNSATQSGCAALMPATSFCPECRPSRRTLDAEGAPQYMDTRQAAISAWFAESFEHTTLLDRCGAGNAAASMFTRMVSP